MTNAVETLAAAPVEAVAENTFTFKVPNTDDTVMAIEREKIPATVRLDLLDKAIENYVRNSVNQAFIRHNKAMEPWNAFAKANEVDPAQTVVKKPEGDMPTVDLIAVAVEARQRLYDGKVRKQGEGTPRTKTDPLVKMVTDAVTRELFDKRKLTNPKYKWTDAVKEVGGDGVKYLDALIAEKVAAGANADEMNKFKESRYIQPAKLMLGQRDTAGTKGVSLF